MASSSRNRPTDLDGGVLADVVLTGERETGTRWPDPQDVGEVVADAIRDGEFYILTHPEARPEVAERQARIQAAFERAAAPPA